MARISVAEAARRLGVGERRVQQRIADGSLPAERIGQRWAIDERDLLPVQNQRDPGRPISERSAWAVIAASLVLLSAPDERRAEGASHWLSNLASSERIRARNRLRDILVRNPKAAAEVDIAQVAGELRMLLGNRANRLALRASPRDLADLRADDRLALAGLSSRDSAIAAGELVEGYIDAAGFDAVVDDYLLEQVQREDDANVILHVVPEEVAKRSPELWRDAVAMVPLVLAVDLAEHRRPREQARAADIVADMHSRVIDP
ncbi:helix-turn-helix domain-containing protein [Terrabacter sp. C0L_2]|uniref:helix-turn-helix domain-containing protein n=1 Tax=Terrabacter sp. C0L_2 TaxID=3108389 RepID=UPI002ED003F6|nr:helix-turn-helix domain-containing protein [Terrabacter sp. C0L_2]